MKEDIITMEYSADYRDKKDFNIEKKQESRTNIKVTARQNLIRKDTYDIKNQNNKKTKKEFAKGVEADSANIVYKMKNKERKKIKILMYKMLLSLFVLAITFTVLIMLVHRFSSLKEDITPIISQNTKSIKNYSEFLAPIVMHDPDPFDLPAKAEKQMKISSSIWRCIIENGTNKYKDYDERGLSLMPVEEIEKACIELFGPNHGVNFKERVFGSFYSLDENEKNFHICAISNHNCYIPYIEEFKPEENILKLTVGYIVREDDFFKEGPDKAQIPTPKKRMIYTLKKDSSSSSYYVESVSKCD